MSVLLIPSRRMYLKPVQSADLLLSVSLATFRDRDDWILSLVITLFLLLLINTSATHVHRFSLHLTGIFYFLKKISISGASTSELYASNTDSNINVAPQITTRNSFLRQVATLSGISVAFLPVAAANAAKYGSFGAGSPEVLDPVDAVVDKELLLTEDIQKSLASVKQYLATVNSLKDTLGKDPQADVNGFILKEFDFIKLRTDLNNLGTVFDEDTQRGTDRLIRIILQDITELSVASKLKAGISRSERRIEAINKKLEKLSKAFEDYLAFAK
jgi:hypothetical protein